jgi:hypothetical protein
MTASSSMPTQLLVASHAPGTRADMRAAEDPDRAEDLHAVWKAVFEHVKVLRERTDGPGSDVAADPAPQGGGIEADAASTSGTHLTHRAAVPIARPVSTPFVAPPASVAGVANDRAEGAAVAVLALPSAPGLSSGARAALPGLRASSDDNHATTAQSASERPTRFDMAPAPASSAVSVFTHGDAIAIVARDATLSDPQALQLAFEVAQQVSGQRSALQHLTLNGRTVYRQGPGAAQDAASPQAARLVFAC